MWSCKSFLHVCADVPSISDALLATSYPNTQIEFRPPLRMLRIVRVSCSREDKHPQHHLANDLGVHMPRRLTCKCVTHVARVWQRYDLVF